MQVIGTLKGSELAGMTYQPLFGYFSGLKLPPAAAKGGADAGLPVANGHAAGVEATPPRGAFRVVVDGYVTADNGTGVVHCAPAFGEDDMRVCLAHGVQLAVHYPLSAPNLHS